VLRDIGDNNDFLVYILTAEDVRRHRTKRGTFSCGRNGLKFRTPTRISVQQLVEEVQAIAA